MLKNIMVKMTIKVALVILLSVAVVLAILSIINYSYVVGWLVGGTTSILSYILGVLLISKMNSKAKAKKLGFWLGFARSWIQMAFHAVVIFASILIDMAAHGDFPFKGGIEDVLSPINFIAYFFGVGLVAVSTLIAHILIKKRR